MRILIIGSLAGELGRAAAIVSRRGASVDQCEDLPSGLEKLRRDGFDLVLCEIEHDVAALLRSLELERISVGVIACGFDADPATAAAAIRAGARDFLPLPPDADLIAAMLAATIEDTHSLVARDTNMLAVIRRAEQVAISNASVLLTGESGTGKEVLARHIHRKSRRSSCAFVAINCAAIPENLLESELFGHEKGAFSGAAARRIGKFETASGGTLLLDEISEMDVRLQAKLLRALQEREIDRVGGSSPVRVDARIIATSNRDMGEEVAKGRFRADLLFRLNVITLQIPPLRHRPGDIEELARHYLDHFAKLNGLPARSLSATALKRLRSHDWPGNVRELENTMHRAVLLFEEPELGDSCVQVDNHSDIAMVEPVMASPRGLPVSSLVGRSMDEVERALILETLGHTLGNRTHAATILGISIRALRNKLKDYTKLGIEVPAPTGGVAA